PSLLLGYSTNRMLYKYGHHISLYGARATQRGPPCETWCAASGQVARMAPPPAPHPRVVLRGSLSYATSITTNGIRGGGGGPPTPARPAQTAARTPPPGNGGASSATAGVPVAAAPAPSPMTSTTAPAGTPEAAANASSLAAAACGVPPRRPRCPHGELPRQRRPQLRALRSWAASWPQRTAAQ
ncbi:unnamed protein product, partial [Prorocentrum cordatum]